MEIQSRDFSENKAEARRQVKAMNALGAAEELLLEECPPDSNNTGYFYYVFEYWVASFADPPSW